MIGRIFRVLMDPVKRIIRFIRQKCVIYIEYAYTFIDSKFYVSRDEPVLFVDCGSNIGQGFTWFSSFYNGTNVDFHLFEPNPNCYPYLEEIEQHSDKRMVLHKCGVGTLDGTLSFYGLGDRQGGKISQGGSISKLHNSNWYVANEETAIQVGIINFSNYLVEQSRHFVQIVVKMDVEGAEVELLEKLLSDGTINLISILYVEFHSQYQSLSQAKLTKTREDKIVSALRTHSTKLRIWH